MLSLNNRAKCSLLAGQCLEQVSLIHTGMSHSCHILCSSISSIQKHPASPQQQNPSIQQKIMDNICTELFFVKITWMFPVTSVCLAGAVYHSLLHSRSWSFESPQGTQVSLLCFWLAAWAYTTILKPGQASNVIPASPILSYQTGPSSTHHRVKCVCSHEPRDQFSL